MSWHVPYHQTPTNKVSSLELLLGFTFHSLEYLCLSKPSTRLPILAHQGLAWCSCYCIMFYTLQSVERPGGPGSLRVYYDSIVNIKHNVGARTWMCTVYPVRMLTASDLPPYWVLKRMHLPDQQQHTMSPRLWHSTSVKMWYLARQLQLGLLLG